MELMKQLEVWFLVGSQHLYGAATLKQVADHAHTITSQLNEHAGLPVKIVLKPTGTTLDEISAVARDANHDQRCIGLMVWMHTFSPAKMWIPALSQLQKPQLQFHTQFNRDLPWSEIDMDFMNLNQTAHGGREFGFMGARLRLPRTVVVGHWQDEEAHRKLGNWMRIAAAIHDSRHMKIARFGDNMRNVAVTEGDKTEAERVFGASINTWAVNDLVAAYEKVKDSQVKDLIEDYKAKYDVAPELLDSRYDELFIAAKEEAAMVNMMRENGCTAGVDNFEDLGTLPQLPGVGPQRFPSEYGWGFSAEGDWKTSVLVRIGAVMGYGLEGGASLMEDYSYNFVPGNEFDMGSHMLEVSPSIGTIAKPKLAIYPLGIGGKSDPVRLVFSGKPADAVVVSMADERERFRLLMDEVTIVEPQGSLKNLPCARAVWKPKPDLKTAVQCWITAGGSHHTCMTTSVGREAWEDFARIAGVELAVIDENTNARQFEKELELSEMYHRLNNRH